MLFVIGILWCLRLGLLLDWSFHLVTLTNIVILHLNRSLDTVGSWEKSDSRRIMKVLQCSFRWCRTENLIVTTHHNEDMFCIHFVQQIKFLRNDWHVKGSFMWHSHFNSCLLLPEPHVFEVYMYLHVIKFSLHGCRYIVCLTLKLYWALEMVFDTVRQQSKWGFNYKNFCNFFKKNLGQYRPLLYEGVFGPFGPSLM